MTPLNLEHKFLPPGLPAHEICIVSAGESSDYQSKTESFSALFGQVLGPVDT